MIDLRNGDCLEVLKNLEDNSVDVILCDPPYELTQVKNNKPSKEVDGNKGFMGKEWDGTGIAFSVELWSEALRVLKPNSYLMAFSGTRTYHRMAKAIEEAGFEIIGLSNYVYGSGFPKALDIEKQMLKKIENELKKQYNLENIKWSE